MSDALMAPHPSARDVRDLLSFILANVTARNDRIGQKWMKEDFGLNLNEWRVLAIAAALPGCSNNDVVSELFMDKAVVSRTLGRLVEKGLARTEVSTRNHRIRNIFLTEEGHKAYDEMFARVRLQNRIAANRLSAEEALDLVRLMKKYSEGIDRWILDPDAPFTTE